MYDVATLIADARRQATKNCGLSDFLYETLVQASFASILNNAPADMRAATEAALNEQGFDPDYVHEEVGEGECGPTGIAIDCCPCGGHP